MSREQILQRVRRALGKGDGALPQVPRDYHHRLTGQEAAERADVIALFSERIAEQRAAVRHVSADELATAIAAALWARETKRIVVPPDLPYGWLSQLEGVEAVADSGGALATSVLQSADGVVTGCAVAVARTGTVVLDGGRAQGRRALTLVPDYHLCVVHADQIVGTVPEAIARLDPCRPLTRISGPATTFDVELERAPGVHGPRALEILVVED